MTSIKTKGDVVRYMMVMGMVYGIGYGLVFTHHGNIAGTPLLVLGVLCVVMYIFDIKGSFDNGRLKELLKK